MATKYKNIYTDLDTIPIYNFMKCTEGKLHFLYEVKKGKVNNYLIEIWSKLYDEYCELTSSNTTLRYYRLIGEIEWLSNRDKITPILIQNLLKKPLNKCVEELKELKEWGLSINIKNNLEKEIEKCIKILNNSKNKLNIKLDEFNEIKDKPKDNISLQSQKVKLHKALCIDVNIMSTSVIEWLAYWDEVKQLSKENNGK